MSGEKYIGLDVHQATISVVGPVKYVCQCGEGYLSGATEWDYLSDWEKGQWLRDIPLIFIFFAIVAAYGARPDVYLGQWLQRASPVSGFSSAKTLNVLEIEV